MFERSKLVPELMVTDLGNSLDFWVYCLGFEVAYQRLEDGFRLPRFERCSGNARAD